MADTSEHTAKASQSLVRQPIFIINTAPIDKDAGPEDEHPHRGNTPWIISVPFLNIAFTARTPDGDPICGFFDDDDAKALAIRVYEMCRSDPKVLADYQENYEYPPDFGAGYKIMQRMIEFQPFDQDN
jgi:hypothetical protein